MESKTSDLIFGIHPVMEAIKAGKRIDKVMLRKALSGDLAVELVNLLRSNNIPYQFITAERFMRYGNRNHQGVVAFTIPVELHQLEYVLPAIFESGKDPFILILDQITDVRNFGAIVRTAECAGVNAIVVPAKGAAQIGSDAVKTSAGAIHHIPICRVGSLKVAVNFLKQSGVRIVAATEKADTSVFQTVLTGPIAVLMGAEDKGISPETLKYADDYSRIPILGQIGSLNVSVAAGVLLYEALRQRGL